MEKAIVVYVFLSLTVKHNQFKIKTSISNNETKSYR